MTRMASFHFIFCLSIVTVSPVKAVIPNGRSTGYTTTKMSKLPMMSFGPTAGIEKGALVSLVEGLVTTKGLSQWSEVRKKMIETGGVLHLRIMAFKDMNDAQQRTFAKRVLEAKIPISVEAGGELCVGSRSTRPGHGPGVRRASKYLQILKSYLDAGGPVHQWLLESVYSRTHRTCASQTVEVTTKELTSFAAVIHAADLNRGSKGTVLYLIDALDHYSVDATTAGGMYWPANTAAIKHQYNLELGATLRGLHQAMHAKGIPLTGYWIDCPYESTRDFPDADAPMANNGGFLKLRDTSLLVRSMGLKVAKTINSSDGGKTSAQAFYTNTMLDWKLGGMGRGWWDAFMVETWYPHPADAIPETKAYTTAYTTLAVFRSAYGDGVPVTGPPGNDIVVVHGRGLRGAN